MKLQGEVLQIIKWEKRNDFVGINGNVKDEQIPHDLIIISNKFEKPKSRWKTYWDSWTRKPMSFEELMLDNNFLYWVTRPHDFQEGDLVNIEISFERLTSHNNSTVMQK